MTLPVRSVTQSEVQASELFAPLKSATTQFPGLLPRGRFPFLITRCGLVVWLKNR